MFESGDGPVKLPAELQQFFKVIAGMEWPEGNVRSMRALSQAWADMVVPLDNFSADVRARAVDLDRSMDGEYADAMGTWLTGTLAPSLDQLQTSANDLSAALRNSAADVEKAQIMMIVAGLMALVQIALLIASLIFAWMAPVVQAATQLTMRMIFQQLLAKLASFGIEKASWAAVQQGLKNAILRIAPYAQQAAIEIGASAAIGAGVMTSVDYFTQLGQKLDHKRDHIDGTSVWQAAVGGAIGGAASGLASAGSSVIVHVVKDAAAQFGKKIPGGLVALGHLGFATGQVLSVAISNPIINTVLNNPDAFWGGLLGALSPHGRPQLPDRSGGEGGTTLNPGDVSFPGGSDQPGAAGEKPAEEGQGSSPDEKPPAYDEGTADTAEKPRLVIPQQSTVTGGEQSPGSQSGDGQAGAVGGQGSGTQAGDGRAQGVGTVGGQSPGSQSGDGRVGSVGGRGAGSQTGDGEAQGVETAQGQIPTTSAAGGQTQATVTTGAQAPAHETTGERGAVIETSGTQTPASQAAHGEQSAVAQQPVVSGGTQLGQLFTPAGTQPSAGTGQLGTGGEGGLAGNSSGQTSTQSSTDNRPAATQGGSSEQAGRPATSTSGQTSADSRPAAGTGGSSSEQAARPATGTPGQPSSQTGGPGQSN
ncbi:hypothetical protein BB31_40385, partial [Amycolatopsis lurida NRRL 2430]